MKVRRLAALTSRSFFVVMLRRRTVDAFKHLGASEVQGEPGPALLLGWIQAVIQSDVLALDAAEPPSSE